MILHWLGDDVRPGAARDTGARTTSTRRWTPAWRSSRRTPRRSTASSSRCSTPSARSSCARRLPDGRADVHRRRLRLPGADPRDGATATRCSASSTRSRRPPRPRSPRSTPATRRASTRSSPRPCRSPATCSARRPRAYKTGDRLPGLPDRPPGRTSAWSAGWRARARSTHLAARSCWPTGPACCRDPRARRRADGAGRRMTRAARSHAPAGTRRARSRATARR